MDQQDKKPQESADKVGCQMCMFAASNFCLCQILPFMSQFEDEEHENDFLRML